MSWTTPRTWVAGELVTASQFNTHVRDNLNYLFSALYPVGSLYFNAGVSTNPATLLGFGTWAAWGAGRVPVGVDVGQTEFDTLEETGGSKTVTLAVSEIPALTHPGSTTTITDTRTWRVNDGGGAGGDNVSAQTSLGASPNTFTTAQKVGVSGGTITASTTIASQGGGGAHQNLQPYITTYIWKRTA